MAAATNSTVGVLETAGEGGAWGMALLAAYTAARRSGGDAGDFVTFLDEAHADSKSVTVEPKQQDVDGFNAYLERYKAGIPAERAAVDNLR
jgi:sugar (pentulose or hexulose) kinase